MASQADPGTDLSFVAAWTEAAGSVGMAPFAGCFTRPTWANMLVLVAGAILSPGRRTVASALSTVGLRGAATFTNYHRVLNRSRWSGRAASRCLLGLLVAAFVPSGPVVAGIDETIERRGGASIKARGIYRDPVRSSHGHFVKASGLRWISLMLLAPVPFAGRVWALPFLTALAPSERYAQSGDADISRSPTVRGSCCSCSHAGCRTGRSSPSPTAATPPSNCLPPCAGM